MHAIVACRYECFNKKLTSKRVVQNVKAKLLKNTAAFKKNYNAQFKVVKDLRCMFLRKRDF